MKNITLIYILISVLFSCQKSKKSNNKPKLEINFYQTKERVLESKGIIYSVDSNLRNVRALDKNGTLIWKSDDVIEVCGKPVPGKPEIRYLKVEDDRLLVVFGKHSSAEINKKTGKVKCLGAD